MRKMAMAWILPFVLLGSCDKKLVEYEKGSVEIVVERGDAWLHDFPLFLGIKRKNPPQIAVRIEDAQGRYLSTDRFVVKVEVNHSTDFNETYPESAKEGEPGYSGGRHGSGQPAVVYAADVDLSSGSEEFEAVLVGHSSPDGSSGGIDPDISGLTSALRIVERITIRVR